MNLDRSLLKDFAKVVNDVGDKPAPKQYVYGTITTGEGNAKYVMLDGSDMLTPISEVVIAEAGDRVLVSVENHQATVIGNITFPPSARKEDQAIESANGALNQSNQAIEKAKDAQTKASSAINDSSIASALANEAKSESAKAQENANKAIQNAGEAKQLAQASSDKSDETQQLANQVKDSVTAANKDISALKTEVKTANDNIASANNKLDEQAGEITTIKETYSTKVETESTKADLTTEISKQVGALQTTVEKNFSTKTENVALEKKLQTQITQNADSISSTVTKVEKLESDTTEQQKNIDKALSDAQAANTAAGVAKSDAEKAKTAADTAQKAADDATAKAESATTAANLAEQKVTEADEKLQQAKTDLAEAQENLNNVTTRVDATEQEIADAKEKVETANANVTKALTDVAEAKNAASKANEAASKAQGEATAANKAASDAQTKAADAQKVANQASADALKAQDDLAALTNRVTKAETNITQTNEAITAQATKITETSNKVDGVKEDLANNYYSKTETDAQIKVSADKISQTVTETNKVVTSANKNATDALNKANSLTDRADKGEFDGRGVASTTVEYQASTSGTTVPTGIWSSTIPSVAQGSYLWTKTTTNYTSGTPTVGYSVARMGVNGAKGDKGNDGKGIKSTSVTYQNWKDGTTTPTGTWSSTPPKTTADKPYLWTRTIITYTDNAQSTSYSVGATPEGIQIGGRNLILNSDTWTGIITNGSSAGITRSIEDGILKIVSAKGNGNWNSFSRKNVIEANLNEGDPFTFAIEIKSEDGTVPPSIYFKENFGYVNLKGTVSSDYSWCYYTGTWKKTNPVALHFGWANAIGTYYIRKIKFEKGNTPTDWTPAPEDIDNTIAEERTKRQSAIETKANEITAKVSETYVSNSAFEHYQKDISSQFTQTKDDFTWTIGQNIKSAKTEIGGQINGINDTLKGLTDTTDEIKSYMSFDKDALTLGKSGNKFKTQITNQEWAILKDSEKVTYINDKTMYITDGQFTESLKVGNFGFVPRANGSLDFKKIR